MDRLRELDMCLWNMDAPVATKSKYGKISKSQILTPPHPQGHVMSVKCEQPLDELCMYNCMSTQTLNFAFCLQAGRYYGRTDGRLDC